jgi:CPA2 family monovalent cation:H+ antiporter-2
MSARLIAPATGQFIMLVVGLSLFATPFAARAGRMIREWWETRHPEPVGKLSDADLHDLQGHVVIAGFGRVGQLLGDILASQDIRYLALENDARAVARLNAQGYPVFFGDAARAELLHKVHADHAAALVLTMDHPASALHAVKGIRRTCPHLPLFARSRDEKHALELKHAGATVVIPEALESGLQLSNFVLQTLGIADGIASHVVQLERERRIATLQDAVRQ